MLVTQFDKFVNRSTKEILGDEIVQENLEPMLSTDIVRSGGNVTGVKGEKEIYYRTGNVNLTSADIGALDEENVYNGLDQTDSGYALDARQGKTLNDAIDNKLDKANLYNGLDQTDPGYALDARQGNVLVEAIDKKLDKANVYNGLDQTNPGYALDARQGNAIYNQLSGLRFLPVTIIDTVPAGQTLSPGVLLSTLTDGIITDPEQIKGFCPFNITAGYLDFLQYHNKIVMSTRTSESVSRTLTINAIIIY